MPDPLLPATVFASALASTGTTTVVVVMALLVVAVVMVGVAAWLIRATRADPSALGPLEVMGDRSWRKSDAETRASSLAAARPSGAVPPAPMLDYEPEDAAIEAAADTPPEPERPPRVDMPAVEATADRPPNDEMEVTVEEPAPAVEPDGQADDRGYDRRDG